MKFLPTTLLTVAILSVPTLAQTQLVRGDVDGIQHTRRFRLKCTNIELVSKTVNLQALHDASRQQKFEYAMQVRDVSSGGRAILNVLSAKRIPKLFDMGNLRLGRADRWHVLGKPGELALVYLNGGPSTTSYLPLGSLGTWLLGTNALFFNFGRIKATGRFEFWFQPPNVRSLVGTVFTGQAVVASMSGLLITNAQCKAVRSK